MNASLLAFYRELTCFAAAVLITVMLSAAFVESTAAVPGPRPESAGAVAMLATPRSFGHPEPARLGG